MDIELRRVESEEDAEHSRFLGSPTLRVDGHDVEPGADQREDFGLKCRIYRTPNGLTGAPLDDWIVAALNDVQPAREESSVARDMLGGRFPKTRLRGASRPARAMHRRIIESFVAGRARQASELTGWAGELDVSKDDAAAELEARDLVWRDAVGDRDRAEVLLAATPGLDGVVLDLPDAVALARELFIDLLEEGNG